MEDSASERRKRRKSRRGGPNCASLAAACYLLSSSSLAWTAAAAASSRRTATVGRYKVLSSPFRLRPASSFPPPLLWRIPRGGSALNTQDENEDEDDMDEEENDDETTTDDEDETTTENDEEDTATSPLSSVISSEPVTVTVKTNLGQDWIDQSMELLVSRTRDVASVKQTLSRQLPGRPPAAVLRLVSGTRVLANDELVDELVEDEEDDEDEEEDDDDSSSKGLVLLLDMVPPVDPKFAAANNLDKLREMSIRQLLEAYTANAAAMHRNSQCLVDDDDGILPQDSNTAVSPLLSVTLRQQALRLRQQLTESFPDSVLEKWDNVPHAEGQVAVPERRGQRYRTARGGARTNMKRLLQRNLNINWADTVRNFMLFLFFGLFGGRNTVSKHLLILGAPLCFVLQARPVKIWLKQIFYSAAHPPGILLSLLPAPQQAILSFKHDKAWEALYGIEQNKEERRELLAEEAEIYDDGEESEENDDGDDDYEDDVDEESEENDDDDDDYEDDDDY